MEISESNGFSCCSVSLPASYEKQHYQGYKYNQTTMVVVEAARKYFVLVLLFLRLPWFKIAVWDEYCHRDINFWYLHPRMFVLFGRFAHQQKHIRLILDTKMHFQEENWLFRKIQRCNMSCQISDFHFFYFSIKEKLRAHLFCKA